MTSLRRSCTNCPTAARNSMCFAWSSISNSWKLHVGTCRCVHVWFSSNARFPTPSFMRFEHSCFICTHTHIWKTRSWLDTRPSATVRQRAQRSGSLRPCAVSAYWYWIQNGTHMYYCHTCLSSGGMLGRTCLLLHDIYPLIDISSPSTQMCMPILNSTFPNWI
jgi:hypothetical protein